jgi:hypothetical protein
MGLGERGVRRRPVRNLVAVALAGTAAGAASSQPPAAPPCAGAEYRQLDFWVGDWDLEFTNANGTIGRAENRITRNEHGDCVISEHFRSPGALAGQDYTGASFSMFDPQTRRWRQMWVENGGSLYVLEGGPVSGQRHVFELRTTEPRGAPARTMRMIWEDVTPASLTWRWQAQQTDGGWRDAWVIRYRRRTPS